ncbi:MAG: mechanosensitive ion channel family protein [Vicinamibacterales bacterium]
METLLRRFDPADLAARALQILPNVLAALIVLLVFWLIFSVTRPSLRRLLTRAGLHPTLVAMLVDRVYRAVILAFGLVMAADQIGINVGAALAGIGVAGIAVGFAAQDTLANVIAGFLIFIDKPFAVGDWVTVADNYGSVSDVTMRSTRIRTPRNTYVVIPNRTIIDTVLVNHSKHGETRIDVPVGIAYKENIPQAREALLGAVRDLPGVLASPAPDLVVTELGASSVNLEVRVWAKDASRERPIYFHVMEASKLALDAAGIEIPYHHVQLFLDKVDDRVWQQAARIAGFPGPDARGPSPAN